MNLNDNQRASLISFVYNIGPQAFISSTLLYKLNRGLYKDVGEQLARWKYTTVGGKKVAVKGLINRRQHEIDKFYA